MYAIRSYYGLKLENWILWILVNIMSIAMYAMKGIMLVSIQYILFFIMAVYGLTEWKRKLITWHIKAKTERNNFV